MYASRPLYKIYTHVVKSYTPRPISHLNQLYKIYTHCIKNNHNRRQKKVGTAPAIMVGSSLKRRPQPTKSNIFIPGYSKLERAILALTTFFKTNHKINKNDH